MNHSEYPDEKERPHIFDNPGNVRRLILCFFVCCALLILTDLVVNRYLTFAEGELPVEGWFGFYAIYGFVACTLIVMGAIPLRKMIMRSEDYYDE